MTADRREVTGCMRCPFLQSQDSPLGYRCRAGGVPLTIFDVSDESAPRACPARGDGVLVRLVPLTRTRAALRKVAAARPTRPPVADEERDDDLADDLALWFET